MKRTRGKNLRFYEGFSSIVKFLAKYTARQETEHNVPIITAFFASLDNFKDNTSNPKAYVSISHIKRYVKQKASNFFEFEA